VLVEGREVRVFARKHPDDPARIQAVPAPADIRARCDGTWRASGRHNARPV